MKAELDRRISNLDRVEALFRSRVSEWIEARDFEVAGGRQAWRSRVAECRTKRSMHIENRLTKNAAGQVTGSWYRYLEQPPLGRDPAVAHPELDKHPPKIQRLPL